MGTVAHIKKEILQKMKILYWLSISAFSLDLEGITEDRANANEFLSRVKRRRGGSSRGGSSSYNRGGSSYGSSSTYRKPSNGIGGTGISGKTVAKVAAGVGAVYVGGKLASGLGKAIGGRSNFGSMEEYEEYGYQYYGRHGAYDQMGNGPYWSEEHRQEMEEIREEPEEEREGPFNLWGIFG